MIGTKTKLPATQVRVEVSHCLHCGEQFLPGDTIVLLRPTKRPTEVCDDPFLSTLILRENSSQAKVARSSSLALIIRWILREPRRCRLSVARGRSPHA